jgi:hypothetical protein
VIALLRRARAQLGLRRMIAEAVFIPSAVLLVLFAPMVVF